MTGSDSSRWPRVALVAAMACLAVAASLTVMMIQFFGSSPSLYLVMLLIFLGAFFYSAPPLRLAGSGYGELAVTVIVTLLVPLLAYLFQADDIHRLLPMATFPLAVLFLAVMLAHELPGYATDIKYARRTLLVRMGWQNGMLLHNLLILTAYLLLALAVAAGMSFVIVLPAFLTLPLGILQIWTINRIAAGSPPNWRSLTLMSVVLFGLVAYLLTFGFWIR
jgi:1,4-dihydroxy-2-naphthoate octaprenyltransferase